jgi:ATP-dependent DNA ligase
VIAFPEWVEPMAATLTQERFTGPDWIFERKFDGIRLLAFKNGQDIRLLSRNRLPQALPSVAEALSGLPVHDVVLDGEMIWHGDAVRYQVFDVMWLDGRDVTSLPSRRAARSCGRFLFAIRSSMWHRSTIRSPGSARAPKAGKV